MACKICGGDGDRPKDVSCRERSSEKDSCMGCDAEPMCRGHGVSHCGDKCSHEMFGRCADCGATWRDHRKFGNAVCGDCGLKNRNRED